MRIKVHYTDKSTEEFYDPHVMQDGILLQALNSNTHLNTFIIMENILKWVELPDLKK
jgi:hypothetical protein